MVPARAAVVLALVITTTACKFSHGVDEPGDATTIHGEPGVTHDDAPPPPPDMPWDGGTAICPADARLALCFTFDDTTFTNGGQIPITMTTSGTVAASTGRDSTPAILVDNSSQIVAIPDRIVPITTIEMQVSLASEPAAMARMGLLDTSAAPSIALFYWNQSNPDVDAGTGPAGHYLSCALGSSVRVFTPMDDAFGNTWHTIGCQCANNTISIYIDGTLAVSETGCSAGQWDMTNGIAIGQDATGGTMVNTVDHWNGELDGLRLWTQPISDDALAHPVWH